MTELLISRGANLNLLDKHNNSAKMLAEKKGEKEVVAIIEAHMLKMAEKRKIARESRTSRATTQEPADPALMS